MTILMPRDGEYEEASLDQLPEHLQSLIGVVSAIWDQACRRERIGSTFDVEGVH
ncbi:MAG TPA: hypothetical protein VHL09_11835 [Dehalococcoidia bacterium]|nr:hypothetical protein [Dehalococcoidia bacterium]